jgi:hypothetical protein
VAASDTEAAVGKTTIIYNVASKAVETAVVAASVDAAASAVVPEAGNSGNINNGGGGSKNAGGDGSCNSKNSLRDGAFRHSEERQSESLQRDCRTWLTLDKAAEVGCCVCVALGSDLMLRGQ